MQLSYVPSVKNAGKRAGNSNNQALQIYGQCKVNTTQDLKKILNKKMGSVEDCEENGRLKL